MWNENAFTRKLGLRYPIIQGPFGGGLSSIALLSAVSNAGGLGSYGAHMLSGPQVIDLAKQIRLHTDKPFNLNLWVSDHDPGGLSPTVSQFEAGVARYQNYFDELGIEPPSPPAAFGERFEHQIDAMLEAKPPILSFVFGLPSTDILKACRERDIVTFATVTTLDEAMVAQETGVDYLVATGFEAGGHRPSFLQSSEDSLTGTIALVPQIVSRVKIPVIAAGGIADGHGVAAALILGAHAVQIGTAFLACEESNASPIHRMALFSDRAKYTALTRAFTGRLSRGIRNRFVDDHVGKEDSIFPFPAQSWFAGSMKQAAIEQNRADLMALWAGQAAPLLEHREASVLFDALVRDTGAALKAIASP
ncbi:MAG TPA: nitronate monooxygenase [Burkholderiales bacterium]|jgi:nitronate monooxygenase|nr:nitronate monooxygenase [Burkholderiales bacterium]